MSTQTLTKQPVDREWVGLARQLRTRCGETADIAKLYQERWIAPLRPKPNFTPMPRHKYLEQIAKLWLEQLPEFGRLQTHASFKNGRLRVAEYRAVPTRLRYKQWSDDEFEQSLSVISVICICVPPQFVYERKDLACFGLHALARRYERASPRTDAAVLKDMLAVAVNTGQDREFEIPVPSGKFVGECIKANNNMTRMVRTFL